MAGHREPRSDCSHVACCNGRSDRHPAGPRRHGLECRVQPGRSFGADGQQRWDGPSLGSEHRARSRPDRHASWSSSRRELQPGREPRRQRRRGRHGPPVAGRREQARSSSRSFPHGGSLLSAAFDRTGSKVITASPDGRVRLWSVPEGNPLQTIDVGANVNDVALSPDGSLVAVGADRQARVWRLDPVELVATVRHQSPVNKVAFSPDGRLVVTASDDRKAKIVDLSTGRVRVLRGHRLPVVDVEFSPDGRRVLTASEDENCPSLGRGNERGAAQAERPSGGAHLGLFQPGRPARGNDAARTSTAARGTSKPENPSRFCGVTPRSPPMPTSARIRPISSPPVRVQQACGTPRPAA